MPLLHTRRVHGVPYNVIQGLFNVDYATARACFPDMVMCDVMTVRSSLLMEGMLIDWTYQLYFLGPLLLAQNPQYIIPQNPMGTMPTVWNDDSATDAQKSRLLWDIRANQGPGPVRMMDALRTPLGRPVRSLVMGSCVYHLFPGGSFL